jgi:hypothetical protein
MTMNRPALLYVTPYASNVAAAKAYKISGAALVKALSLQGIEVFHDGEGS